MTAPMAAPRSNPFSLLDGPGWVVGGAIGPFHVLVLHGFLRPASAISVGVVAGAPLSGGAVNSGRRFWPDALCLSFLWPSFSAWLSTKPSIPALPPSMGRAVLREP